MARLSGCLDAIGAMERKVLVLRAGVGPRRPHTRRAVAVRLDVPVRRVARAERRGLRQLRDSASAGRCGAAAPGVGAAAPPASGGSTTTSPAATEREARAAAEPGISGVKDEFRTGGLPDLPTALVPPAGDATEPPLLILVTIAFLAGFAAVWAFDRRRLNLSRRAPPAPRR